MLLHKCSIRGDYFVHTATFLIGEFGDELFGIISGFGYLVLRSVAAILLRLFLWDPFLALGIPTQPFKEE
jgi:hypothetical protein